MTTSTTSPHPGALARLYPLLFVALCSTGFLGAKFGLPDAEPQTFLSVRFAAVLVLMGALGWLVFVLSLGAVSLLNLLIRRGSAVHVASLFYLTPPTTALFAWALFGATLAGWALVGMGLALVPLNL